MQRIKYASSSYITIQPLPPKKTLVLSTRPLRTYTHPTHAKPSPSCLFYHQGQISGVLVLFSNSSSLHVYYVTYFRIHRSNNCVGHKPPADGILLLLPPHPQRRLGDSGVENECTTGDCFSLRAFKSIAPWRRRPAMSAPALRHRLSYPNARTTRRTAALPVVHYDTCFYFGLLRPSRTSWTVGFDSRTLITARTAGGRPLLSYPRRFVSEY